MDQPKRSERSRSPTPQQYNRAAAAAVRWLEAAPPLALAAAVAALFELLLARVGWYGLADVVEQGRLVEIHRWARFPRNLAALCGLVALAASLVGYLRLPGFAPIGRRLAVAAFAGIFVPSLLAAIFLPAPWLRARLVIFGLAAANVLVTLIGMSAIRYRSGRSLQVALAFVTLTAFLVLTVVGVRKLAEIDEGFWAPLGQMLSSRPNATTQTLLDLRHLGELCWVFALLAGAFRVFRAKDRAGRTPPWWVALAVTTPFALMVVWYRELTGHLFRVMLYGAFQLDLLRDDASYAYALPLAAGLAAGLFALTRPRAAIRQLGAGLLLWLCAGYAPHTSIQLLYLVLATVLMARSAQALDPEGSWRRHHPLLRLMVRYE